MLDDFTAFDPNPGPLLAVLPDPDPEPLALTAVAFANTDGGTLVIGAGGVVPGAAALANALRQASARVTPPVAFSAPRSVTLPGGPALAVHVPRGDRVHALRDGRVLARTTFGNRALNGDEIRALIADRATGDFEAEAVPGARIADLDPTLLAEFMGAAARRRGVALDPTDLPLVELGAVTPDHRVTVAGLLLFGRDPARWLPHAGVHFARYVGRRRDDGQRAFERELSGPLAHLLADLWRDLRAQMRVDVTQPDHLEYPEAAVREVLVNAVLHRDYRLRSEAVRIELFADRLEITSPGGLPAFVSNATLIESRYSRNPRLGRVLTLWGAAAGTGGGILRTLDSLDRRGCRPPEIETGPYRVTVRLYNAGDACAGDDPGALDALNERQRAALAYVELHGSITYHEFRAQWPALTADQLQRDLSGLVERGHLRRIGSRAGAYYMLP